MWVFLGKIAELWSIVSGLLSIKKAIDDSKPKVELPKELPPQKKIYAAACAEYLKGIKETPGAKAHEQILNYIKSVSSYSKDKKFWSDEYVAWCSCFVNWCVTSSGFVGTDSGLARSWLKWGTKISEPQEGDIVVFSRGNSKIYGHVAFFRKYTKLGVMVEVLGGNQSDALTVAEYPRFKVLGYRRVI